MKNKQFMELSALAKKLDGFAFGFSDYHEAEGKSEFLKAATGKKYYESEIGLVGGEYVFFFHVQRDKKVTEAARQLVASWERFEF